MNYAIEGLTLFFCAYLAIGFVLGAIDRFFARKPAEISTPVEAEEPAIDSAAILEEVKVLTAPVYARAEAHQVVAAPVELSDRELIKQAKDRKVPMAHKMSYNRALSANVRAKLIEAIA